MKYFRLKPALSPGSAQSKQFGYFLLVPHSRNAYKEWLAIISEPGNEGNN